MAFKPYNPDQGDLFGWRVSDCLEDSDPAYIIAEVVAELDMRDFAWQGEGCGQPPYAPQQMLAILLYGMIRGVFSSRSLAASCRRDMGFIYLSAGARPCFKTICNFRNSHGVAIRSLMSQVISVLRRSGIAVAGRLVLDSTRIAASASRDGMIRADSYDQALAAIDGYLDRSARDDQSDDDDYGDDDPEVLPAGLRTRRQRAAAVKAAIERARGGGRKAVSPVDAEAEQMRMSDSGKIKPGYALQAGIDKDSGVITVSDASCEPTDNGFLAEAVRQHRANVGEGVTELDADSGYYSAETLRELEADGIDTCVADGGAAAQVRSGKQGRFGVDDFEPVADADVWLCPMGQPLVREGVHNSKGQSVATYRVGKQHCSTCPVSERCLRACDRGRRRLEVWPNHRFKRANRQRFEDPDHAARYRKRGSYIERVFGHLKHNLGLRQWLHRGLEKVRTTAALIGMAHNIALLARVRATRA